MARKYEVHIGAKTVVIGDRPLARDVRMNWLTLRVDDAAAIRSALRTLKRTDEVPGVWLYGRGPARLFEMFASLFRCVQAAGGAVTDGHGRLLVIRRKGRLDLPKGKVEGGESIEQGAVREVMEECGLRRVELVRPLTRTWHVYERKGRRHLKRTDWFLMRASSRQRTEPQAAELIEEVMWFRRDDVRAMRHETYPSLRRVLNAWAVATR